MQICLSCLVIAVVLCWQTHNLVHAEGQSGRKSNSNVDRSEGSAVQPESHSDDAPTDWADSTASGEHSMPEAKSDHDSDRQLPTDSQELYSSDQSSGSADSNEQLLEGIITELLNNELESNSLDMNDDSAEKKRSTDTTSKPVKTALTEREVEAMALFSEAQKLLNRSSKASSVQSYRLQKEAYRLLEAAAELDYEPAEELVSWALLYGSELPLNVDRSKTLFERLSERGSPAGQLGLGFLHAVGIGVNSSQAKALVYLTFAALGGNHIAMMMLAYRHFSGISVEQNCETALTYYKRVASEVMRHIPDSQISSGQPPLHRVRLPDEVEASGGTHPPSSLFDEDLLQYYQFLANKGDVQAQVGLGQLYYTGGRGVDINHQLAFNYFSRAAQSGNANAMAFLGKMYAEGTEATAQDNATALSYFQQAAEQNNPIGQHGLGMMYLNGQGIDRDHTLALKHLQRSSELGWVEAHYQLGLVHLKGLGKVRPDLQSAVRFFTLASQGGNLLAVYRLADMHARGQGVLRSCLTATELLKNVAERGRPWGERLMEAYQSYVSGDVDVALMQYLFLAELGYEVAQTNAAYILDRQQSALFQPQAAAYQRALVNWKRSASQGYALARVKVGDYHYYGLGTPVDYTQAAAHYRIAIDQQRNPQAMFNLAYMHERGEGTKRDFHLAKRYYDMAAETSEDAQVPVALALAELGLRYLLDLFQRDRLAEVLAATCAVLHWQPLADMLDPRLYFGPYWDFYLMVLLAALLTLLLTVRYRVHFAQPER